MLAAVNEISEGRFEVDFDLDRNIAENTLKDSFVQLGGHPFFVESNEGGTSVKMVILQRTNDANGDLIGPPPGPVVLPVMINATRLRASTWTERVGHIPLTTENSYSFELRNKLNLSADNPRAFLWVGVSAADDQPYIPDPLAPLETRPGNESPIVPVLVQARFWGRPEFDMPPPLEPVPEILAPEPEDGPVDFDLDITPYFDPAVIAGIQKFRVERVDAGIVFGSYYVDSDRVMALSLIEGEDDVEVVIPNADDADNIRQTLGQSDSRLLANRYVVFLAASHPHRSEFFEPTTPKPIDLGPYKETLPPASGRYAYRIRAGNASGLISSGDGIAKVIVRVPSLKPGPGPERILPFIGADPGEMRFRTPAELDLTHLLCFYEQINPDQSEAFNNGGGLVRIANRPDLYPDRVVRLRSPEGAFATSILRPLDEPEQGQGLNDGIITDIKIEEQAGTRWRVWACSLTRDGVPSELAGPWQISMETGSITCTKPNGPTSRFPIDTAMDLASCHTNAT